jgi:hypothetical protein
MYLKEGVFFLDKKMPLAGGLGFSDMLIEKIYAKNELICNIGLI